MSIPQDTQETNNLYLLLIAESRVHGMLVAPKTSTSLLSTPTPAIKKDKDKHKYKIGHAHPYSKTCYLKKI